MFLLLSVTAVYGVQLTSNDPYWLGDNSSYGTTEGNDFWLTFMNNATFDPSASINANIKFELNVIVAARQQTTVVIEVGGIPVTTLNVQANQTETYNLASLSNEIYLYETNETVAALKKGVHVYSTNGNFSCFSYSRVGEKGSSSRDASLIIPTEFLGKEYIVQTYPIDDKATEFAIVATENNTIVNIVPACETYGGQAANSTITLNLNKGDAYLLASTEHHDDDIEVDLSGTKICSDKPIAVFNGNIQTKIDYAERNSEDHLIEQSLPITQLGTNFYLSLLDSTKTNRFRVTASQPNTRVQYFYPDASWYYEETLGMGQSTDPIELSSEDDGAQEVHIVSDKPVILYGYMTSGAENVFSQRINNKTNKFGFGDPANAMLPSWAHRAKSMNFFIKELDPFKVPTNSVNTPQRFYAYLVVPTADITKISVKSGNNAPVAVPSSTFHAFGMDSQMSHGCISLPGAGYHLIESTGEGFVGYVYGMSEAQGYFYTLGYTPDPFHDSIFVTNPENIMSKKSYDLPRIENGWYQRQWDEWVVGHERLDTVVVCDSSIVDWLTKTPIVKQATPVDWYIYDVTGTPQTILKPYENPVFQETGKLRDSTSTEDWFYKWEHQFILPDEKELEPHERVPFMDFEVHAVLHKKHLLCNLPDDYDTLRTVVRVTRIYHDTIYRHICMGDSYQCFKDSFPNQGNLNIKGTTKSPTTFIGDKTDGESAVDFQWKARPGENIYRREYQTIFGCDSTYTLYLFVCDTFRRVDTLHLCDNQSLEYEHKKFKGVLSEEEDGTTVTKDTVAIIYDKTTFCGCMLNPKYPHFDGCDSIFELHLMIHKTYRDTLVDTMCYNDKPDSLYHWPIQYGARDSLIGKNHPNMVFDDALQAWIGWFSDTLQTTTCPDCRTGGCDSINILKLIIPKSYYFEEKDDACAWVYNRDTRTKDTYIYRWEHHRNGAAYVNLPNSGEYYDSCQTRFGCDSIYHLTLTYHEPFLKIDQHAMATNQIYRWHGNVYGPFITPEFKNLDGDTTLYFYNDNETQVSAVTGCDSIYRLDLMLMDTYLFKSYKYMCDYDSIHWRDSIIVGSKWEGTDPYDIRITRQARIVYDSLKTVTLPIRDSVYMLTVTMLPSYKIYDTLYVCDNDSVEWQGQWYQGSLGTRDDIRAYTTTKNPQYSCDSTYYLHLIVKQSYHFPVEDSVVCRNEPFVWTNHTHLSIPTDVVGEFMYYDSCVTKTCPQCEGGGCDSIYTLRLYVAPIYHLYDTLTLCASDSLEWQGLLFTGDEYANYGGTYNASAFRRVTAGLHAGEYTDTAWYATKGYGCDSIYHLALTVLPVYRSETTRRACQSEGTYHYEYLNNGVGGDLPARHLSDALTRNDTMKTALGCDSIVTLHFFVDSVYNYTDRQVVCQAYGQEWTWYEKGVEQATISIDKGDTTWVLGRTYQTIHGCDSIYGISVYVAPIYHIYDTLPLCGNDSLHWQGMLFTGYEYANYGKTYDPNAFDSVKVGLAANEYDYSIRRGTALYSCDSVHHLHLTVLPIGRETIERRTCQSEGTYHYENLNNGVGGDLQALHLSDSLTRNDTIHTALGCDSIVTLHFYVDSVYNYTQGGQFVCQAPGETWEWRNDFGDLLANVSLDKGDTTLILGQHFTTIHGCDSSFGKTLYIAPIYHIYDTLPLCGNDSLHWRGMLFTGYEYANYGKTYDPTPFDSVKAGLAANEYDYSIRYGTAAYGCDSVHHLHLTVLPIGRETIERRVCQSNTPYSYENLNNGAGGTLPARYLYQSLTRNDTIQTALGCDSIVTLHFFVDSVYNFTSQQVVCQAYGQEWTWYEKGVEQATISIDKGDTTWILGRTYQTIHGCDSMYGISVYVAPIYHIYDTLPLCGNDSLYWHGMLFTGYEYANYGKTYDPILFDSVKANLPANEYDYAIHYETAAYSCDSVHHLHLKVLPIGRETIERRVCKTDEGYAYENLNNGQGGILPAQYMYDSQTRNDTIHTVLGCDSIVTLHFYVDSVYDYTRKDTVCQAYGQEWIWYENGVPQDTISIDKGDTTFVLGRTYPTVHGCDSMYGITVYVAPIYHIYDTLPLCGNDSLHWHGMLFTGYEFSNYGKTYDPTAFDSIKANLAANEYDYAIRYGTAAYDCDSVHHLHLKVSPIGRETIERRVCQSNTPYPYENLNNGQGGTLPAKFLSQSLTRNDTIHTTLGCDSIVTLHFFVDSVYNYTSQQVVCQAYGQEWIWMEEGVPQDTISIDRGDTTFVLGRVYHTIHGCDSIYGTSVYVAPIYHIYDTLPLCGNDSLHWQGMLFTGYEYANYGKTYDPTPFDSIKVNLTPNTYDYAIRRGTTAYDCDSVHHLHLTILPIGRETIERRVCQSNTPYPYENLNNGIGGTLPAQYLSHSLTRNDTIHTALGCDSIVTLNFFVDSVYNYTSQEVVCQAYGQEWIWYENGVPQDTISIDRGDTTFVLGRVYHTIHGCDSTYGKSVYVAPIYHFYDTLDLCENDSLHWQGMLFTGNQYTAYGKTYNPAAFDSVRADIAHGTYHVDINRPTIHSCDSTYHLTLFVHEVAHTDSLDSVCQGSPFFNPNWNWGQGMYMPTERVGTYVSVDTIPSRVTGCDSIVTLTLRVDSVYHYNIQYTFCQDTIDTMREWIDEEGKSHGFVLDISQPGDFRIDQVFTTIHGCDSTYGVIWHVDPIYRFDTIIDLCENSRTEWQRTRFTGDSVRDMTAEDSVILVPGTYYEFRHYETVAGCDSDYYATIHVHAVYDTLTLVTICENEGFVWHQTDFSGLAPFVDTICPVAQYDTIHLLPSEAIRPQALRDTVMIYAERMLTTSNGCDSLSRLLVTIKPTYFFFTDTTICANERVKYRNQYFSYKDTVYTEHLYTVDGCDSIYQMRLHVRPIFLHKRVVTMCDNETLYHTSLNGKEIVWKPGDEVRDPEWEYYDMIYTDHNGCDSIYRYHLTIYPSYLFTDTIDLCSSDSVELREGVYVGEHKEFPIGNTPVAPYPVLYSDTFQTVRGCDSIYVIYATIYPTYRHRDTIYMCDDGSATWRAHYYEGSMFGNVLGEGLPAGEYIYYDSLLTAHQCDSIYELHLIVTPTHLFEEYITKCADEDMTWRSINLDHVAPGEHFFYDSLRTVGFGCDSVYHLYLTVNDTTNEIIYDTICRTEIYDFHGKPLTEEGYYYDTTLNEVGCHHFTHLHLGVIEPTVPTAWADSICADEDAYDLFYTYTGRDPIAYSVLYDDEGHLYGFEDIINEPITTPDELSWLRLPMPLRNNDSTQYPRPDYYNIRLVLDNGICTNPDLCTTDTGIVLSYPSWITRQRFGDVIALYNEKYNGGYYWSHYQWYHGDTLLVGETHEYLYIPSGLVVGDQYHVRLTREGETQDFQTCPITIIADPIANDFAPTMGYLSVVPTCVVRAHPVVSILSRKDGMYRITTMEGIFVGEGVFRADVTEVEIPNAVDGMYIFQLWSVDTPEEPYRVIKVLVNEQCIDCKRPF